VIHEPGQYDGYGRCSASRWRCGAWKPACGSMVCRIAGVRGAHQHQLEVLCAAGGGEYQERTVGVLFLSGQSGLAVAHGLGDWRVGSGGQSGRWALQRDRSVLRGCPADRPVSTASIATKATHQGCQALARGRSSQRGQHELEPRTDQPTRRCRPPPTGSIAAPAWSSAHPGIQPTDRLAIAVGGVGWLPYGCSRDHPGQHATPRDGIKTVRPVCAYGPRPTAASSGRWRLVQDPRTRGRRLQRF
jgi:hypothetical protein